MLWDMKEAGEGLSYSKMAARSGGLVAVSTLHSVMSGKTKELTPDTITGLARILNTSEAHVLAALRGQPLNVEEAIDAEMALFASRVKKLTPRQKKDFQIAWRMANDLLDRLESEGKVR